MSEPTNLDVGILIGSMGGSTSSDLGNKTLYDYIQDAIKEIEGPLEHRLSRLEQLDDIQAKINSWSIKEST